MGNKGKIGGALAALALLTAIPFITDHEGESLEAYRDVVGVATICNGETLGVKLGDIKTKEECRALTESRVGQFLQKVHALLKVEVPAETLAAHTSFAYNIGIAGYARSSTLRLTNESRMIDGCEAMKLWYKAGGRDCRIRKNNCYGVWQRRQNEVALCLRGIKG